MSEALPAATTSARPREVAVVGAGSWGTCLALLLRRNGHSVRLWCRRSERVEAIRGEGENRRYLPGIPVPPDLFMTSELKRALGGAEIVVFAVPSQHLREVAGSSIPCCGERPVLVAATKGIEEKTLSRMTEVLTQACGRDCAPRVAALVGPSHAEEVARQLPTAVVSASSSAVVATAVQDLFMTETFRVYTNEDLVGVELAVSLKNVIALAAGLADGCGFGDNTRGALLTRGLAEMTRLGVAMGAQERTFWGLAGLGDLITTCVSPHSRNRRVGEEIARGAPLGEVLERMGMVAEGVPTTRSALRLAEREGVEMPIAREVYSILFEGKAPVRAMDELMRRLPRAEVA